MIPGIIGGGAKIQQVTGLGLKKKRERTKKFLRNIRTLLLPHSVADKVMTDGPSKYTFRILLCVLSWYLSLNEA